MHETLGGTAVSFQIPQGCAGVLDLSQALDVVMSKLLVASFQR
jgi:hypothetical protein